MSSATVQPSVCEKDVDPCCSMSSATAQPSFSGNGARNAGCPMSSATVLPSFSEKGVQCGSCT
eukprot:6413753-Karenia_brevis.AAC.1